VNESASHTVTVLLNAVKQGEPGAHEKLWCAMYDSLRALAAQQLVGENNHNTTINPTSLVHEAYLRLLGEGANHWENRRHFFFAAARAMRQIRIDAARHRCRAKRGGGKRPAPLDGEVPIFDDDPAEVLAVDEALTQLETVDDRAAQVVKLRYFAGLTVDEAAEVMELSPRTVQLTWKFARTWLHRELTRGDSRHNAGGTSNDGRSLATDSPTL
jgi:RNA polymerase sigma factor (TIGR02999 family)